MPARRTSRFRPPPLPQVGGLDAVRVVVRPHEVGATAYGLLAARFPAMTGPSARDLDERFSQGDIVDQHGVPWGASEPATREREIYFHRELRPEPYEEIELPVIFEDEHLLVVDKPHDVASIPRGAHVRRSALVRLRIEHNNPDLSPIHRLDKQTAGILVLSKRKPERGAYQELFSERRVRKAYEALVTTGAAELVLTRGGAAGAVRDDGTSRARGANSAAPWGRSEGRRTLAALREGPLDVTVPIRKTHGDMWAHAVPQGVADGPGQAVQSTGTGDRAALGAPKPAHTTVTLLDEADFADANAVAGRIAHVRLVPHTGRTHQLRVHLDHVGLPIVGDELYPMPEPNPATGERGRRDTAGVPLQLVSAELGFTDPFTGEEHSFRSLRNLSLRPLSFRAFSVHASCAGAMTVNGEAASALFERPPRE